MQILSNDLDLFTETEEVILPFSHKLEACTMSELKKFFSIWREDIRKEIMGKK